MMGIALPWPYVPGNQVAGSFEDRVQQNFDALSSQLGGLVGYTPAIAVGASGAPAFQNSWVNFGSGYKALGFYKDALGFVHLEGSIKSGTAGSLVFTLPVGYRPAATLLPAVTGQNPTVMGSAAQIDSSGNVQPATAIGNAIVSFDSISFRAEQ